MLLLKHLLYISLLVFLIPAPGMAQEDEKVVMAGIVVDADSGQVLPSVHLRVWETRLGGVTESDGRFRFYVGWKDTIVFSSVGYKPYFLLPADSSEQSLQKLIIRLKPQVTVLEAIEVKNYRDVSQYLQPKIDSTVDMRRSRGTPLFEDQPAKEMKAVTFSGGQLTGAVTAFANLFNDEFQQKKKLKEILAMEEKEAQEEALKEAMTEKYHLMLTAATNFAQNDIERFTQRYMPPPRRMAYMSDYEVMEGIIYYLDQYEPEGDFLDDILQNGKFEGQSTGKTFESKGKRPPMKNH